MKSPSTRLQSFRIPTDASPPPIIHLQFGYSRRDVSRVFLPLLLLLVLPPVLTLWMRRAVLRKPDARRSGAWFGYWRFLQWNMLGSFVLWVTAIQVLKLYPFLEFVLGPTSTGQAGTLKYCAHLFSVISHPSSSTYSARFFRTVYSLKCRGPSGRGAKFSSRPCCRKRPRLYHLSWSSKASALLPSPILPWGR